jgi:hypothetical protein
VSSLALARVGNPFSRGIAPRVCVIGDGDCDVLLGQRTERVGQTAIERHRT